jgi:hypothetical protein
MQVAVQQTNKQTNRLLFQAAFDWQNTWRARSCASYSTRWVMLQSRDISYKRNRCGVLLIVQLEEKCELNKGKKRPGVY